MKEYLVSVTVSAFFMSICSMITPGGELKKQVESVVALMVMAVIISPIISVDAQFDSFYSLPDFRGSYQYNTADNEYVNDLKVTRFENAMSEYINEVLYKEYSLFCDCKVVAKTDENGVVMGVERVYVIFDTNDTLKIDAVEERICRELGIDKEQIEVR